MIGQRWRWIALTAVVPLGVGLGLGSGCAHPHATPPPPAAVPPTKPERERAAETGLPISGTAHGILRDGAERRIQRRLQQKGFLDGEQTVGQLDPKTRAQAENEARPWVEFIKRTLAANERAAAAAPPK